jgi:hypothetical protein
VLSGRNWSEIIGKNPKNFRWEYCFHVPVISDAFLPEPARNFRPGKYLILGNEFFMAYYSVSVNIRTFSFSFVLFLRVHLNHVQVNFLLIIILMQQGQFNKLFE